MSPEQISGREVDARSDVYALACLLYEMIAGRPPFIGSDDVQTLYRQLHEPPEPLSLNAADIPAALDKVVNRALAKNPHDRYGSMQELARALNAAVEKRRGDGNTTTTALPGGRDRRCGSSAAFAAGVAITAGAWSWRRRQPKPTIVGRCNGRRAARSWSPPIRPRARVELDGSAVPETTPTAIRGVAAGERVVSRPRRRRAPVARRLKLVAGARTLVQVALPPSHRAVTSRRCPRAHSPTSNSILQKGWDAARAHRRRRRVLPARPSRRTSSR